MKYIRFKNRGFVLFENTQNHAEMAKLIGDEVESAGFATADDWCDGGQVCCHGESLSLDKHSAGLDKNALRQRLHRI